MTISKQALVKNVASLSEIISLNSTAALAFNDQKSAGETLKALSAASEIVTAALYNRDGKLFAQYLQGQSYSTTASPARNAPDNCPGEDFPRTLAALQVKYAFQRNHLELVNSVLLEGQTIGHVYLKSTLAPLHERLRWFAFLAILAILPSLLLAYLFSSQFQRIISQPIMGLARTMKMISQEKDYGVQVPKPGGDELGVLIDGFNEMLSQIQKRDAELEQHRDVLEQEVARRTAELSQSNRELERTVDELNRTAHFLAQNESRLAYAQQVARLGYWEWEWHSGADKLICSGEVCRLLGLEPKETGMGREDFLHFIHPDDRESIRKAIDPSLPPGKAFGVDCRIIAADGGQRVVNLQGEVIIAQADKLFKMAGTIQDITERKAAENALGESEEKYRALVNNASEGILLADVAGNLLEANRKMLEMLDYSLDELLQLQLFQIIPPAEALRNQEAFQDVLGSGSGSVADTALLRQDGKIIPIDITASLVRYAGKTLVQVILRDISERKKMEEERLLLSKLESLGLLAGGIAHDFNNILAAILGNISLAKLDADSGHEFTGYSIKRLAEAEKACQRARALAGQLLSFAKGGLPIKKAASAAELIKESINLALSGSKARSQLILPKDLWLVEVDEGQISQVLNNMLINADQAMPQGGVITVQAENVTVGAELPLQPGDYVKIAIRDQGIGIPSNYLGKIFDPYFTTKQKGSGLGLATSFSIIRNNAGYITVESEVGVGTSFFIYLPATQAASLPERIPILEPVQGQGRILVMDDEEVVRNMLGNMLDALGYEAACVADGAEAIILYEEALAGNRPFTAAIFDLTVPGGMGGKEAVAKLLALDPHLQAIVSSGYSDDPIMSNFREVGFKGVIAKPYRILDLSLVLHEVIAAAQG